ncbi:hypothetical protein [Dentiradicibacter hellwigii]|uniref:CopG family transcriptional regulator n=1 Tax=Dentiradicibacter hellwigii TaxID=3149053 RepID=A0ABV4UCG6_9RHOO
MSDAHTRPTKRRVGRPTIIGGRRVNVYLDDESLDVALALGDGNISAGIRVALTQKIQKILQKPVDK